YYLSIPRFIDSDLLKNGSWPPKEVVHSVTVDGVPVGALSKYVDTFTYAGLNATKMQDYLLANEYFKKAYANDDKNNVAIANLALNYVNQDSLAAASQWADRGLALSPDNEDFLLPKGMILMYQGKVAEAYEYFDRVKKMNKRNVLAYYYSAIIMENQKNYSAALDNLQKVLEQAPQFKQAYLLGAQIMQNSGNPEAAARYMEAANNLK
ncbi:MAG TPA: hypothetical protein PLC60_09885, partial [Saprospiraceae bacterium]|nr:hypothetical protein [Saprospiraceae bacterium]